MVGGRGAGGVHSNTPTKTQTELVDATQELGDLESLPMHLALARTRAHSFEEKPVEVEFSG